jgi:hypothetical protein
MIKSTTTQTIRTTRQKITVNQHAKLTRILGETALIVTSPGCLISGFLPENHGVLTMKNIAEIRRRHKINGESISSLAKEFKHSRNTIRKHLETVEEPVYQRQQHHLPKLGEFETQLLWLEHDAKLPRKQRRTAQRLFEYID